jgi:hypothetical protein
VKVKEREYLNLHSLEYVNKAVEEGRVHDLISSFEAEFDGQVSKIGDTVRSQVQNCHLI